ncbi:MAG TPA: hypothetical protein VK084_05080 [Chitinophagaceae bacterium]|nr:hypothetical protein [Chitinophagaceae bacterium]
MENIEKSYQEQKDELYSYYKRLNNGRKPDDDVIDILLRINGMDEKHKLFLDKIQKEVLTTVKEHKEESETIVLANTEAIQEQKKALKKMFQEYQEETSHTIKTSKIRFDSNSGYFLYGLGQTVAPCLVALTIGIIGLLMYDSITTQKSTNTVQMVEGHPYLKVSEGSQNYYLPLDNQKSIKNK